MLIAAPQRLAAKQEISCCGIDLYEEAYVAWARGVNVLRDCRRGLSQPLCEALAEWRDNI
jgi:hypothetical protein